jgi:small subunit ribosomal protein S1
MNQNLPPDDQEATDEIETQEEDIEQQETTEIQSTMEDLLEDEDIGLDFPRQGEIRKGTVARVTETEILVSIGTKSEGVIPSREVDQLDEEIREEISIGKEITVYVVNPEDQGGNVLLSYVRALEEKDWLYAEAMLASGETFEGTIIGFNKGGLIIPLGQLRGFVPASQVSLLRRIDSSGNTPEQRWGSMLDEAITVSVIEVDRERRRLILSERVALQETRESLKERLLDELNEGDVRTGRVTSLADFGAFVNIDGADGLVHLSEISWERIEHPREVLRVGQEVQVKVIGIDRDRKRIGLSIRQLQEDPWVKKIDHLKEGQLIEGTITHLTKFGAFARLDEDLEGLIHISEISEQRVAHPKEVLHEGDVVTLRVIKIEPERHRIGLSMRKVDSPAYTDFDWKMTLAEVVDETHEEEDVAAEGVVPVEAEAEETVEGESAEADVAAEEIAAEVEAVVEEASEEAEVALEELPVEAEAEEMVEEEAAEADVAAEEVTAEVEAVVEEASEEAEVALEELPVEAEAEEMVEEEAAEADVAVEEAAAEVEAIVEETSEESESTVVTEAESESVGLEEPEGEIVAEAASDSLETEEELEEMTVDEEELAEIKAREAQEMLLDVSELGEGIEEFEPQDVVESFPEGEVEEEKPKESGSED